LFPWFFILLFVITFDRSVFSDTDQDAFDAMDNPTLFGTQFSGDSWAPWKVFLEGAVCAAVDRPSHHANPVPHTAT
jgi:hypothetical protein